MFTILYSLLFIIFFSLGFLVGKKYQEHFFYDKPNLQHTFSEKQNKNCVLFPSISIELSKQYDTIGEVSKGVSFLGILKDRIDLILLKESDILSREDKHIKDLITENKVFLRVIVQIKEK